MQHLNFISDAEQGRIRKREEFISHWNEAKFQLLLQQCSCIKIYLNQVYSSALRVLWFQVMESSILSTIEQVKMRLMGESSCCALGGSTAELREDLDQAKTQIGMTESLLNALSPSDSLEIFTKLEVLPRCVSSLFRFVFTLVSDGLILLKLTKLIILKIVGRKKWKSRGKNSEKRFVYV